MTKVQHGPWAGNGVEDERTSMLNLKNDLGPSEQPVAEKPCGVSPKPSGMPLNEAFTAEGEMLSVSHVVPGSPGLGAHTSAAVVAAVGEEERGPTKSELDEDDAFKAMLTIAVTTPNPTVQEESVSGPISKTTTEGGVGVDHSSASLLANTISGTAEEEEAESSSHPSAAPQPTLYPSSPGWETASDHPAVPTPWAQGMTSEVGMLRASTGSLLKALVVRASMAAEHPLTATEASLEAGMSVGRGELPATAGTVTIRPLDTVPPDWDDTKPGGISQGGSMSHEEATENLGATEPSQTLQGGMEEEEDATRVLPSPVSPPPTPGLAEETNCTALVQGEVMPAASTSSSDALHPVNLTGVDMADLSSLEDVNATTTEGEKSILPSQPEAAVVTDEESELSPTLESSWEGKACLLQTLASKCRFGRDALGNLCFLSGRLSRERCDLETCNRGRTPSPPRKGYGGITAEAGS